MDVSIKKFNVDMAVKTSGIEFEVQEPNGGGHRGDLILTRTGLEWCEGRVRAGNGKKIKWNDFIAWANACR
jgi:hypothetical protein